MLESCCSSLSERMAPGKEHKVSTPKAEVAKIIALSEGLGD